MKLTSTLIASVFALTLSGSVLTGCNSESTGDTADTTDTTDTTSKEPQALTGKDVAGHWASKGCEAYPNGQGGENYLTRDFTLTETDWSLKLVIFGDNACSYPLFTADIAGPFTLGELSEKVEGTTEGTFATEGNFEFKTIEWTAHDAGMAETFTMSGCGTAAWEVGKPQDVTGTGCIGVAHKVAECPVDHDVVAVDGDELFFGERVTDMCKEEGRPAALGPYPVVKQ